MNLAAVDLTDGKAQPWPPRANRVVLGLAVIRDTIYVGGAFSSVSGVPRANLAAFTIRGGALTDWNPGADQRVYQLLPTPAGLVALGEFITLGGMSQVGFGIFPPTRPNAAKR